MQPLYLGDGAYVQEDPQLPDGILLTTGSHLTHQAHALIYLGPGEIPSLLEWLTKWKAEHAKV